MKKALASDIETQILRPKVKGCQMNNRAVHEQRRGRHPPVINSHRLAESHSGKQPGVVLSRFRDGRDEGLRGVSWIEQTDVLRSSRVTLIECVQGMTAKQLWHQLAEDRVVLEQVQSHGNAFEQADRSALAVNRRKCPDV